MNPLQPMFARTATTVLLLLAVLPALAQPPAADAAPLPDVEEVLAAYVDAMGGEEAIRRQTHFHMTGTFHLPAMGLEGELEAHQQAPKLFRVEINAPGLGTIVQGFDGETAWETNPMTGARVLEGGELELFEINADILAALNFRANYASIEVVGFADFNGEPCVQLKTVTAGGIEQMQYFSTASGLLVGGTGRLPTQMGDIQVSTRITGYKELGGILLPTEVIQEAMGSEQIMRFVDVDFEPIDPEVFALPTEIAALKAEPPAP